MCARLKCSRALSGRSSPARTAIKRSTLRGKGREKNLPFLLHIHHLGPCLFTETFGMSAEGLKAAGGTNRAASTAVSPGLSPRELEVIKSLDR